MSRCKNILICNQLFLNDVFSQFHLSACLNLSVFQEFKTNTIKMNCHSNFSQKCFESIALMTFSSLIFNLCKTYFNICVSKIFTEAVSAQNR